MLLVIDNYDSFVHNLARYFQRLGQTTLVRRNDQITVREIRELPVEAIVLSPGPCAPPQAGCCLDVVRQLGSRLPILGVCLGHQAIAAAYGGHIVRAREPVHGRTSLIEHQSEGLFEGLPNPLRVGRYHSLTVDGDRLPGDLRPLAWTEDRTLMAIQHAQHPVVGLQFHPESVLTEQGYALLAGFLRLAGLPVPEVLPETMADGPPPEQPELPWPPQNVTF